MTTTTMTQNEQHWAALRVSSPEEREKISFMLMKLLDDSGLLIRPIRTQQARAKLTGALKRAILDKPLPIKEACIKNWDLCFHSLWKLTLPGKRNETQRSRYYADTASGLLRDECIYITTIDGTVMGPFLLSEFLCDRRGLYKDGTVDERLLDYVGFLACIYGCGFSYSEHQISLWHEETSSEGVETLRVYDYTSWVSAMIEVQNVLQSVPQPFEFCITERDSVPGCDSGYECASDCDEIGKYLIYETICFGS